MGKHRSQEINASVFRKYVDAYNTMIAEAEAIIDRYFLLILAEDQVRTAQDVQRIGADVL